MYFKLITLFLVGMMVLAFFGKLRFPGQKKLRKHEMPEMRPLPHRQGPLRLRQEGLSCWTSSLPRSGW